MKKMVQKINLDFFCFRNGKKKKRHPRGVPAFLENGFVSSHLDPCFFHPFPPSGSNPGPPTTDTLGQYQPAGNNETPLERDDLNSDVIVNAQLTHLISRDDAPQGQDAPNVSDVPMPDVPTVDDIATPRRIIGGRCRKWCISAQPASGKRKCAACDLCGIRFTHGEARLQQWVTVKPIITTYMHIVSMEGSVMIMNCSQNKPQIRMQLMQSPANGTPSPEQQRIQKFYSLSLRIRIKPQQLRHLTMSETFLDEKRLSEWMKKSWTSSGSNMLHAWDSIKDLRGTTYVQPPTRFRFALQQAQHAILRAIIHNNPTSPASESAWKALVLSSWLLLGRPAVNASESNCAHFLDA